MIRFILGLILGIFMIMFVGSILLTEFPQLQPLFEEGKTHVVSLYNMSMVRYGAVATLFLIIAILFIAGDSKRGR